MGEAVPASVALTPAHPFVRAVLGELHRVYAERLVSVALFGSVARGTARPDSDLDILLIVKNLPRGRRARLATFNAVEEGLAAEPSVDLSPVLRTPEEVREPSPLLLDLTEDAVILHDRGDILKKALDGLRDRLCRLGARRIWVGTRWYWDLKPDYRRGEIIRV